MCNVFLRYVMQNVVWLINHAAVSIRIRITWGRIPGRLCFLIEKERRRHMSKSKNDFQVVTKIVY